MKNSKLIIIILFAVIVVIGIIFQFTSKPKSTGQNQTTAQPTETPTVNPTQVPQNVSAKPTIPSQYSDALKAKIRSEFINTCHTLGKYTITACNCGADYLSANYSEDQLAKMYLDYHTTNIVPNALQKAADVCASKK
jgi:hypothetical protein